MIDLSLTLDSVRLWVAENIQKFRNQFPDLTPVCIGLYSSPANGWVSLCLDVTPDTGYPKMGCADFSHPEYALLEFPDWANEYETEAPMLKRNDRKIARHTHNSGDEAYNLHFYDFLMRVINDHFQTGHEVCRPVWAGVRILDSRFVSFGRIHKPKG